MIDSVGVFLLIVVLFIALVSLARSARVVSQYEKGLILRLGHYRATAGSGLTFLVPVIGPRSARSWTCSAKCSPSRASSSSRRDRIS